MRRAERQPGSSALGFTHTQTHMALIPSGQIEFVGEEIRHAPLLHLFLQPLQEVGEPFEGVGFPADPIEVDLKAGSERQACLTMILPLKRGWNVFYI